MTDLSCCGFVIPCFNESESLAQLIENITLLRKNKAQVVVVDGGSCDGSIGVLQGLSSDLDFQLLVSAKGRATQMNYGATHLFNDYLFFLHADSILPADFVQQINYLIEQNAQWGFFQLGLSGNDFCLKIIARLASLRSRITSVATGDQLIFVKRQLFEAVGCYQDIPLMEDIALSKKLRQSAKPLAIRSRIISSSRRWQKQGVFTTVLLMWTLRLMYLLGVSPEKLHKLYYD